MSISYYDFKNLPDRSQQELVMAIGTVISETYKDALKFVLYQMPSFTVEIVYNINNNTIASVSSFQNTVNYEN